ncbi:GAF domain-containing protein [Pseudanabaena sp. FACHB-2040]|uniref:GAF domain-containing sensor histidine kinase n=1 Tax=Pseudanabaena sp. FACHB-2040 TaxID=2692859 RepID=UPI0016844E08|nr:GAF domain-containing protein [Pseudanabaena sp. FACHB-2040]MBD2259500.1 GAF domain-containing protein [Pseudanabaena sp. FACHB-2040]
MPSSQSPGEPLPQEALLRRIANRIRQSLELQEILTTTAAEVRAFLGTDRVKIYQFQPDGHGVVIAESLNSDRLPSLHELHFPADDIPPYARELFVQARQRSVVDLSTHEIGISPLHCSETDELIEQTDIRYRPVDPCHQEYLMAMGVKSSVVVPIVLEGEAAGSYHPPSLQPSSQLWGLLVSHNAEPRVVSEAELQFIQAVVDQVAVAIAQSILLEHVRAQARQEANINQVTALLQTSPTVNWQDALQSATSTLEAGGRLYLFAIEQLPKEIYTIAEQPALIDPSQNRSIEENLLWQKYLHSVLNPSVDETGRQPWSIEWMRTIYELGKPIQSIPTTASCWAINDIYQEPLFRTLAPFFSDTTIRSALIISLKHGTQILGCLTFFRSSIDTEILWAGYHHPDTRQLMPRQSFEVWRQLKKNQAQHWTKEEIQYAQVLGERFAATIKQYRLHQQVQALNANLERQVEERTEELKYRSEQLERSNAELERLVERQTMLSRIVTKIRDSLDIETIFRTTTEEVRHLLNVNRVVVYRFKVDWSGEFVAESVAAGWTPLLERQLNDLTLQKNISECSAKTLGYHSAQFADTYLQNTKGGQYAQGAPQRVVRDIYQAEFSPCYLEALEGYQAKAYIIVPIFQSEKLWGLLAAYQNSGPRDWEDPDVALMRQIGLQLGVALQQAEHLSEIQDQSQQLTSTVEELKRIQTQLIHSEKMSSLGQLVAGIAHEVNNPINFIYGNIKPFKEYTQILLELIQAYQQHYPNPAPDLRDQLEKSDLSYIEEDLPKLCESIRMGAERIRGIVQSLRNFSRLDEAEIKSVDLHEGLESTLLILHHRLKPGPSGIAIKIEKHYGNLPYVNCYAGQLNQVFMNLISNAIDELLIAAAENGVSPIIMITTSCVDDGWVAVSIKDNGRGVPTQTQAKLFDPFFTTKPIGQGTGLGLSISYQIVEKHGGQLLFQSQPSYGTEFVVRLPVQLNVSSISS